MQLILYVVEGGTDIVNTVIVTLCVCYLSSASGVCILLHADFLKNCIDPSC